MYSLKYLNGKLAFIFGIVILKFGFDSPHSSHFSQNYFCRSMRKRSWSCEELFNSGPIAEQWAVTSDDVCQRSDYFKLFFCENISSQSVPNQKEIKKAPSQKKKKSYFQQGSLDCIQTHYYVMRCTRENIWKANGTFNVILLHFPIPENLLCDVALNAVHFWRLLPPSLLEM